jgi:hypothetical protein
LVIRDPAESPGEKDDDIGWLRLSGLDQIRGHGAIDGFAEKDGRDSQERERDQDDPKFMLHRAARLLLIRAAGIEAAHDFRRWNMRSTSSSSSGRSSL